MFEGLFGNVDEDSGTATSTTAANFAPNAKVRNAQCSVLLCHKNAIVCVSIRFCQSLLQKE